MGDTPYDYSDPSRPIYDPNAGFNLQQRPGNFGGDPDFKGDNSRDGAANASGSGKYQALKQPSNSGVEGRQEDSYASNDSNHSSSGGSFESQQQSDNNHYKGSNNENCNVNFNNDNNEGKNQ
ncbi:hypothetical protein BGZ76_000893 [Entomortierella beljakovae]|nr:hypothetical protein BGZ76_000893 [Entomortierella beljakovae]